MKAGLWLLLERIAKKTSKGKKKKKKKKNSFSIYSKLLTSYYPGTTRMTQSKSVQRSPSPFLGCVSRTRVEEKPPRWGDTSAYADEGG
jgi:hypothetical protein